MKTCFSARSIGTALILLFAAQYVIAQPQMTWSQVYGGERVDRILEVIQLPDGDYVAGGSSKSFGQGSSDFYLIRTDDNGNITWESTFGLDGGGQHDDNDDEICLDMIQVVGGGYALAGWTESEGAGSWDFWLLKTDEDGNELWSATYGGERSELCYSIKQDCQGGYSLAGYSRTFGASEQNAWLVKTDDEGNLQWTQNYGGGNIASAEFWSHVRTSDDGYALCGQHRELNQGQNDYMDGQVYVVKTDGEGDEIWSRTFGGAEPDLGTDIVETEDGGFVIAGARHDRDEGVSDSDYYLIKVDEDGDLLWSRTYGLNGRMRDEVCYSLQVCADGGFILTGKAINPEGENDEHYDVWLVRTDENGQLLWSQYYGGNANDCGSGVILTGDGGYASAGTSQPFQGGRENAFLIKIEPDALNGEFAWIALPDTGFAEDRALVLELVFLREHIECLNDNFEITVDDGENVFGEIIENQLIVTASENWWGTDDLTLTATSSFNRSAMTVLRTEVMPINDPPGKFNLLTPVNYHEAESWPIEFQWEESEQTEFEEEEFRYRISFSAGEEVFEVTDLEENSFTIIDENSLLENLNFAERVEGANIAWSVSAFDGHGAETECNESFNLIIPPLSVSDRRDNQPLWFALLSPAPNPFNSSTSLSYSLDRTTIISLRIYDRSGRLVTSLFEGTRNPGQYSIIWNASGIPTGIYYVMLEDGFGRMGLREVVLLK